MEGHRILRNLFALTKPQELTKIQIGGPVIDVEIDETKLYKRKYKQGSIPPNEADWAVGGICGQTKEVFVVINEGSRAEDLLPIIRQYVRPGSSILTPGWRAHNFATPRMQP